MSADLKVNAFLSQYNEQIYNNAINLGEIFLANLPGIIEQIDLPARMIAYCYGQKCIEMICTIIPSKKGLKLAFYKGADLPDPCNLLEGTSTYSRYGAIKPGKQIDAAALENLIENALKVYRDKIRK